jgi:hypothetical protein
MATSIPAAILGWERALGSLQAGKRADVVVIDGRRGDPYRALLHADEADVRLVVINGVPRVGMPRLMQRLGATGERIIVGGEPRLLNLVQAHADPVAQSISLAEATAAIADALANLGERPSPLPAAAALSATDGPQWYLALDELGSTGVELRPRLRFEGAATGPVMAVAAEPLPLEPVALDALTAADDPGLLPGLAAARNLPEGLAAKLATLYR